MIVLHDLMVFEVLLLGSIRTSCNLVSEGFNKETQYQTYMFEVSFTILFIVVNIELKGIWHTTLV